jgi:hypothetical protein
MTATMAGLLGAGTILLVPGQVAGAAPAGAALAAECADVVDQAASTAGTAAVSAAGIYGCAEPDLSAAAATATSINAVPCGQQAWNITRTTACANKAGRLNIRDLQTQAIKGILYYTSRNEVVLNPKASTWTHTVSFTFDLARSWGYAGTTISGTASCTGACTTDSGGSFGPGSVTAPGARSGTATFRTTVSAVGQVGTATSSWKHWFNNVTWFPPTSNSVSTQVGTQVRCDNKLGGGTSIGCVFPILKPTLVVSPANPTYHRHIQLALQYNMRRVLTRMQDPVLQDKNRSKACPSEPRPDTYTCDEYPFASTFQGAFTGNHPFGRTFAGCQVDWLSIRTLNDGGLGYSACLIGKSDNTNGGVELGKFYNDQRVLDNDTFNVSAG